MTLLDPPAALFSPTRENFPSHSIPTRYSLHVSKLFQGIREILFPITSPQGVRAAVSRTTSVCRTNNRGGPALLSIHTLSRTSKSKTYLDHLSIIKIIFLQVESPAAAELKLYCFHFISFHSRAIIPTLHQVFGTKGDLMGDCRKRWIYSWRPTNWHKPPSRLLFIS
jgi:hypothetical protein